MVMMFTLLRNFEADQYLNVEKPPTCRNQPGMLVFACTWELIDIFQMYLGFDPHPTTITNNDTNTNIHL